MARILYGIHGTGHGHAMRGLTIARALPQHEFLFIANDDALSVLEPEFQTVKLPNLGTVFKNYRIDFRATITKALPLLWHKNKYIKKALEIIEKFKPDACMADLEFFTPRAAAIAGLPCLTLDHQHIITCCRHDLPANMLWDAFCQGLTPKYLFRPTEANLLISFYSPPLLPGYNAIIAPPILRDTVLAQTPHDAGHILVYQSNSTDRRLIDFLRKRVNRPVYVFGYVDENSVAGNIIFRKKSEAEFLDLLAGCAYVIQGGSHTLMSEALYLGKPVLALPLLSMVEQRFNAYYLEKSGFGLQAKITELDDGFLAAFEKRIPEFKARITSANFFGNPFVFDLVERFVRIGKLTFDGAQLAA